MTKKPTVIENFMTKKDNSSFVKFLDNKKNNGELKYIEEDKRSFVWNLEDKEIVSLVQKYALKISQQIKNDFPATAVENLYPHLMGGVIYETGGKVDVHNDYAHALGCKNCLFGAVIYLNEDYSGGEIYFPNLNLQIHPKTNSLIYYPMGSIFYDHGSKIVDQGQKYVLPMCFTFDETLANKNYMGSDFYNA